MQLTNALMVLTLIAGATALPQFLTVTANGATQTYSFSQPTAFASASPSLDLEKRQQVFTFTNSGNTFSFSLPSGVTIPGQATSTAAAALKEARQFTFSNTFSFSVPSGVTIPGPTTTATSQAPAMTPTGLEERQFTFTNSGQAFSFSVSTAVASLLG